MIRLRGSDTRVESKRYNSAYAPVKIHISVDTTKGTALGRRFVLPVKQRVLHFVLFYCIVLVRICILDKCIEIRSLLMRSLGISIDSYRFLYGDY